MTQDLTKDDFIHQRGEDNQLLPRRVELQTLKPENIKESSVSFDLTTDDDGDLVDPVSVKVKPAKPGQLNELQVDLQEVQLDRPEDMTSEIYEWVVDYLVEPDLDGTDADFLEVEELAMASLVAIISESNGQPQEKVREQFEADDQSFQGSGDTERTP